VPTNLLPCCKLGYGVGVTVKLPLPVAVPPAVVTDTVPVTAPGITNPTNVVPVLDTTIALAPPIVKAVGLPILVPIIVTSVPTAPLAGLNEVIVGGSAFAKGELRMQNAELRINATKKSFDFFIGFYLLMISFFCCCSVCIYFVFVKRKNLSAEAKRFPIIFFAT
jgi:hypothetical protein